MRSLKFIPFLIAFASLTFHGCTSMLLVKSSWDNNQIVVDGSDTDWDDGMFYVTNAQLTAGIRNDSKYMYLILKTTNRRQAFQILGLGLTVWFDPKGGTDKKFGIHFPLGRRESGEFTTQSGNSDDGNAGFTERTPNELEITGVNKNGPVRLTIADTKGIELQIHNGQNSLIYEMKVPLHASPDHPYAIGATGTQVGIGFEGGKFEPRQGGGEGRWNRGRGEGMPGGTEGGGGEGMPGGMEGGEGMPRRGRGRFSGEANRGEQPKQIDFWLKVTLAKESQQANARQ